MGLRKPGNFPDDNRSTIALLFDIEQEASRLASSRPQEILSWAIDMFSPELAVAFSGAEDVILIDMVAKLGREVRIFTLDTGRLHAETYHFIEKVREHYGMEVEVLFPQADEVEKLVRTKGLFSFYRDGHQECCAIRKVGPLKRFLANMRGWVTGLRHDQSPGTRQEVPVVQLDPNFSNLVHPLVKINPLASWRSSDVWTYIRNNRVPYNPLHEHGYISIGCEPCTRPVLPGEHERAGRWWWEEDTKKECGLHKARTTSACKA